MLTRKRSVWQVLGGGRRANGDRHVFVVAAESLIRRGDLALERGRKRCRRDPASNLLTGTRQRVHVIDVKHVEHAIDTCLEVVLMQKLAKRKRCRRESLWNAHAGCGELADHLAQRCVLPAHQRNVCHAQVIEPDHPWLLTHAAGLHASRQPGEILPVRRNGQRNKDRARLQRSLRRRAIGTAMRSATTTRLIILRARRPLRAAAHRDGRR